MIRITGGDCRGRRLKTVRGTRSRPTLSRVREAVFNILGDAVPDAVFLDLFAGTGAMGIEALSRGAARVVFVETNAVCRRILGENLSMLGLRERAEIVGMDAIRWAQRGLGGADIVFADPPYASESAARILEALGRSGADGAGYVIIQHGPRVTLPERAGGLVRVRCRTYGDTVLDVYEPDGIEQGDR